MSEMFAFQFVQTYLRWHRLLPLIDLEYDADGRVGAWNIDGPALPQYGFDTRSNTRGERASAT